MSNESTYAAKTVAERWLWHAGIYAFRRVILGISDDEHTSPCDPEGKWFDERLVAEATARLRAKHGAATERRRQATDRDAILRGRALSNEWARKRGHADLDAYAAAKGVSYEQASAEVSASILANSAVAKPVRKAIATALGVRAHELAATPKQVAAVRRELGLEPTKETAP